MENWARSINLKGKNKSQLLQRYNQLMRNSVTDNKPWPINTGDNIIFESGDIHNRNFYEKSKPEHNIEDNFFYQQFMQSPCLQQIMKRLVNVQFKEQLIDTIEEMGRTGNFVCIFPSAHMTAYRSVMKKPVNQVIHRLLFSNEIFDKNLLRDQHGLISASVLGEMRVVMERETTGHMRQKLLAQDQILKDLKSNAKTTLDDYVIELVTRIN